MTRGSSQNLRSVSALLLSPLLIEFGAMNQTAEAGLLQPLIQLLQPRIERRLVRECRQLTQQLLSDMAPEIAAGRLLNSAVEQPCRSIAQPVSECLITETSRSGRELGVLTELLEGRVGDDAGVVIQRCLASLTGLPRTSLNTIPVQELLKRLRR